MFKHKYLKYKYLKYKEKYKALKRAGRHGQYGGSTITLSGPVKISYYVDETTNKKFILVGDIHLSKKGDCEEKGVKHATIDTYLEKIVTECNDELPIDIFVEQQVRTKEMLIDPSKFKESYHWKEQYIVDVYRMMDKLYKKYSCGRVHFTDIRKDLDNPILMSLITKLGNFDRDIVNLVGNVELFKETVDLKKIAKDYFKTALQPFYVLEKFFDDKDITNLLVVVSQRLIKELNKLKQFNPEYFRIIAKMYMQRFLRVNALFFRSGNKKDLVDDKDKVSYDKDSYYPIDVKDANDFQDEFLYDDINEGWLSFPKSDYLSWLGDVKWELYDSLQEMYTLSRIYKSDMYNNNIIYVGVAHIEFYKEFFNTIGAKKVHEVDIEDEKYFRCINTTDFISFFNKTHF